MEDNVMRIEELNKFLSSIQMGSKTFKIYRVKADDDELIELIDDTLKIFQKQELEVAKIITDNGAKADNDLSLCEELVVLMEKLKMPKSDFDIVIYSIKALNMGVTNGLEFIHKNRVMNDNIKTSLKKCINEYSELISFYTKYISKYLV